jgi:hypothetical protein
MPIRGLRMPYPGGIGQNGFLDGVADDDVTAERVTGLVDGHQARCVQSEVDLIVGHRSFLST